MDGNKELLLLLALIKVISNHIFNSALTPLNEVKLVWAECTLYHWTQRPKCLILSKNYASNLPHDVNFYSDKLHKPGEVGKIGISGIYIITFKIY